MASLGNDLATIRKQKEVTLEEINDTTKIPVHILEAIENDSIFTDFDENKTYIRGYVRSYGKALKIDEPSIIEALDQFEIGTYSGGLLDTFDLEQEEQEDPSTNFDFNRDQESEPNQTKEAEEKKQEASKEQPDKKPDSKKQVTPQRKSSSPKKSARKPGSTTSKPRSSDPRSTPPEVSSVDWADVGRKFRPLDNRSPIWIGAALMVIIIAAVIGYWFYLRSDTGGTDNTQSAETAQNINQPAVVPDSLQLNLTDSTDTMATMESQPAPQALPDTLNLVIYAAYDRLDPVRVSSDVMGSYNPYWIEQGQAVRFEFLNTIRIRGTYNEMELLMNGHPIENFEQQFLQTVAPDSQFVEINRDFFEQDNRWMQPAPDSTELTFPPPASVTDRPVFPTANN